VNCPASQSGALMGKMLDCLLRCMSPEVAGLCHDRKSPLSRVMQPHYTFVEGFAF
jgi:hypothetical protein